MVQAAWEEDKRAMVQFAYGKEGKMIQLSEHFTYQRLLRFTFPSVVMMVFTSIYGVVDGFFVSNFAGKTSFAAVNFIMPVLMILGWVYVWYGRKRPDFKDNGGGEKPEGERDFFHDCLCVCLIGDFVCYTGVYISPANCFIFRGRGQDA